jgi:hypothetical protein
MKVWASNLLDKIKKVNTSRSLSGFLFLNYFQSKLKRKLKELKQLTTQAQ